MRRAGGPTRYQRSDALAKWVLPRSLCDCLNRQGKRGVHFYYQAKIRHGEGPVLCPKCSGRTQTDPMPLLPMQDGGRANRQTGRYANLSAFRPVDQRALRFANAGSGVARCGWIPKPLIGHGTARVTPLVHRPYDPVAEGRMSEDVLPVQSATVIGLGCDESSCPWHWLYGQRP